LRIICSKKNCLGETFDGAHIQLSEETGMSDKTSMNLSQLKVEL